MNRPPNTNVDPRRSAAETLFRRVSQLSAAMTAFALIVVLLVALSSLFLNARMARLRIELLAKAAEEREKNGRAIEDLARNLTRLSARVERLGKAAQALQRRSDATGDGADGGGDEEAKMGSAPTLNSTFQDMSPVVEDAISPAAPPTGPDAWDSPRVVKQGGERADDHAGAQAKASPEGINGNPEAATGSPVGGSPAVKPSAKTDPSNNKQPSGEPTPSSQEDAVSHDNASPRSASSSSGPPLGEEGRPGSMQPHREAEEWLVTLEKFVGGQAGEITIEVEQETDRKELREAVARHLRQRPQGLEDGPRLRRAIARAFEVLGKWREAEMLWAEIVGGKAGGAADGRSWGTARIMAGDDAGAAEVLAKVVEVQPEDGVAWYRLGVARENAGDHAGALTALDAAIGLLTGRPLAHGHFVKALVLVRVGRLEEGEIELKLALAGDEALASLVEGVDELRPLLVDKP